VAGSTFLGKEGGVHSGQILRKVQTFVLFCPQVSVDPAQRWSCYIKFVYDNISLTTLLYSGHVFLIV